MNIIEFTQETLKRPEDFYYFGDLEEELWGRTISHNRDSDTLVESNWEVVTEDMRERFPDDVQIERADHWGFGWVEELRVRMLDKLPVEEGNITPAGRAIHEWHEHFEEYPIADEEHHSRMEHEELEEYLEYSHSVDTEDMEYTTRILFEDYNVCRSDDIPNDEAVRYAKIVGRRRRRLEQN